MNTNYKRSLDELIDSIPEILTWVDQQSNVKSETRFKKYRSALQDWQILTKSNNQPVAYAEYQEKWSIDVMQSAVVETKQLIRMYDVVKAGEVLDPQYT